MLVGSKLGRSLTMGQELQEAALTGDLADLQRLLYELRHKTGMDFAPRFGDQDDTALHLAAKNGHHSTAQMLIRAGSRPDKSTTSGTPQLMAEANHNHDVVTMCRAFFCPRRCPLNEKGRCCECGGKYDDHRSFVDEHISSINSKVTPPFSSCSSKLLLS